MKRGIIAAAIVIGVALVAGIAFAVGGAYERGSEQRRLMDEIEQGFDEEPLYSEEEDTAPAMEDEQGFIDALRAHPEWSQWWGINDAEHILIIGWNACIDLNDGRAEEPSVSEIQNANEVSAGAAVYARESAEKYLCPS